MPIEDRLEARLSIVYVVFDLPKGISSNLSQKDRHYLPDVLSSRVVMSFVVATKPNHASRINSRVWAKPDNESSCGKFRRRAGLPITGQQDPRTGCSQFLD